LRAALARTIRTTPALGARAAALSDTYRAGAAPADGRGHIHDAETAAAYAAARMPATHAAILRALTATATQLGAFGPASLLDLGAGTGAATWAALETWPGLERLTLIEREPAAIDLGRRIAAASSPTSLDAATWQAADIGAAPLPAADLVVAAYVLGELGDDVRTAIVDRIWAATSSLLVLVEPGSRAGFERIRTAREALINAGGHVVAPCPGDDPCPIEDPAWCHFLARLDRSPLQRRAKSATRSWEDEPLSYVAVSRTPGEPAPRVVLGRPRRRPGIVELRICADGRIERRILSRRDGPAYHAARDLVWGDPVSASIRIAGASET
jgi:ribosomal protein RSM22 (predicted rRNA methylase)